MRHMHLVRPLRRTLSLLLMYTVFFTAVSTLSFIEPVQASFLERWQSRFRSAPPPRRSITRGDGFCPLGLTAGTGTVNRFWGERPTLLWQGEVAKLELWQKGGEAPLWNSADDPGAIQEMTLGERPIYTVTLPLTLQSDRSYEWRVYEQPDIEPAKLTLQMLPDAEQQPITQALRQLDQDLATQGITGEAALLERADYFAGYGSQPLWLNFWQTMLSLPAPSAEVKELVEATVKEICTAAQAAL